MSKILYIFLIASAALSFSTPSLAAEPESEKDSNNSVISNVKSGVDKSIKKVTKLFSKNKGENDGNKKNTETAQTPKKIKITDAIVAGEYYVSPKKLNFKSDEDKKLPLQIEVYANLYTKERKKIYKFRYYIECSSKVNIPAGAQILIRTGNDKVYKAITKTAYTNVSSTNVTYQYNAYANEAHVNGLNTQWSDIELKYDLEDGAIEDMAEFGVKKIRIGADNDFNFSEENFQKLHSFLRNFKYTVDIKSERIKDYEPPKVPEKKPTEIPEF